MPGVKDRICSIVAMVLCILILPCVFMPLLKLDLSPITGVISSFFSGAEVLEDGLKYSLIDVIKQMAAYREELGGRFWLFFVYGIFPYVSACLIFGLSWVRGKVKHIVNACLAFVTAVFSFCVHRIFIPSGIESVISKVAEKSIGGGFLDLFNLDHLTDVFAEESAKVYVKSLTIGFYFPIAIFILIMVVSVIGFIVCVGNHTSQFKNDNTQGKESGQPVMVGISGVFEGARIALSKGEVVIIGRDASQCSLIIPSESISRKHCEVSFDYVTGQYRVVDYSVNGTFINDKRRLMKNQPQFVRRGEVLSVGDEKNSFRLE